MGGSILNPDSGEQCFFRWIRSWLIPAAGLAMGGCEPQHNDPWVVARREASPTQIAPPPPATPARPTRPRTFRPNPLAKSIQTVEGWSTDGRFGHAVAGAGDVNGDGFADVLVGAFAGGREAAGETVLYLGSANGIGPEPSWCYICPMSAAEFGHQVEGVGDVNGDGFADFIVGATYYSEPGATRRRTGGAFAFYGGTNGPGSQPDWQVTGEEPSSSTGFAVAAAGDVNGDGYADVLVGAWNRSDPNRPEQPISGRVALYLGGPLGLAKEPAWNPQGEKVGSRYGYTLHGIGDVNGDGYADLAIGSWGFEAEQINAGRAYVYHGGPLGPTNAPDWTITGGQPTQLMGNSVFAAGDVNDDGFADLIVGANATSHPEQCEGLTLVFLGSRAGLAKRPAWTFESNEASFFFGHSVATAGDVNGDGFADVVISAFNGHQNTKDEGVAFVFLGSANGLPTRPDWSFAGGQARGGYGSTVRCAGDVNGDGYDDLIIGQTYYSGSIPRQGRAWLHYGSATGLAQNSHWRAGIEAVGFSYRNLTLPWPNRGWFVAVSGTLAAGLVLATRGGYRLRARRVAALQAARESAQRQERLRLSQDLHDQLGAELTQMVLAGGHARRQLAQNQLPDAKLAQIESTAQGLVESLGEIVWLTKPTNDTLDQLANYLGDLTSSVLEKAGLECVLEIPTDLPNAPVSYDLRHDLVLAVKEALHNAIKHAGAHAVSLTIKTTATEMSMVVRDSGRGFGEDTARTSGNGINHMKARLAKHGGSATVASTPEGVVVTFTVPWSRT